MLSGQFFAEEAGGGFEAEDVIGFVEEDFAFLLDEVALGVEAFEFGFLVAGAGVVVFGEVQGFAGEAGEGVDEADELVGVGGGAGAAGKGNELAETATDFGGGHLEGRLREPGGIGAGEEVGEGFLAGADFFAPFTLAEPVLVTTMVPAVEVGGVEVNAVLGEALDNGGVGGAVEE